MTMIEKIARAIYNNEHGERTMEECINHAKAALEAMKKPSEGMVKEGAWIKPGGEIVGDSAALQVYQTMIEAALKE